MAIFNYDTSFEPPAPVVPLRIGVPVAASPVAAVEGFVDTGADITAIPRKLARQLQLRRVDTAWLKGIDGKLQESPVFSMAMSLGDTEPKLGLAVVWEEDYALLGRDFLNERVITLDGPGLTLQINL